MRNPYTHLTEEIREACQAAVPPHHLVEITQRRKYFAVGVYGPAERHGHPIQPVIKPDSKPLFSIGVDLADDGPVPAAEAVSYFRGAVADWFAPTVPASKPKPAKKAAAKGKAKKAKKAAKKAKK